MLIRDAEDPTMTAKRIAKLVALAAATLVSASAMAQAPAGKSVSEAEKNYQAGGSPLADGAGEHRLDLHHQPLALLQAQTAGRAPGIYAGGKE